MLYSSFFFTYSKDIHQDHQRLFEEIQVQLRLVYCLQYELSVKKKEKKKAQLKPINYQNCNWIFPRKKYLQPPVENINRVKVVGIPEAKI